MFNLIIHLFNYYRSKELVFHKQTLGNAAIQSSCLQTLVCIELAGELIENTEDRTCWRRIGPMPLYFHQIFLVIWLPRRLKNLCCRVISEEFPLPAGEARLSASPAPLLQKPLLSVGGPVSATNCLHLRKNIQTRWGTPKIPLYILHTERTPLSLLL